MVLHGGKGSSPPPPDYTGAAEATGDASKDVATQQTWANRPNQFTPWGSSTWNSQAQLDPATGQPVTSWTQRQQLNPQLQGSLDSQLNLQTGRSDLAGGMLNRVSQDQAQPFDWTNLPGMAAAPTRTTEGGTEAGFSAERDQYTNAAMERMRPEHQFQEEAARTRLANSGLTPGSEAYNRELQRLSESQAGERWNAVNQGGVEQQRMQQMLLSNQGQAFGQNQQQFNSQNAARQQAIAEQAQQRGMSLNEMNALLSGQQVNPMQMPSFTGASMAQAPNYAGAAQNAGQYGMQAYQADLQNQQANMQGLGSLAGMAAMAYFSDRRLKTNIFRVGTHKRGVGIYEYDIFGHRERGVMAQEVLAVAPELVAVHPSGYLTVNYGGL
jgi:hypothetical protein